MALTATIYNFDVDLSDSDRGVYETIALRVALKEIPVPGYRFVDLSHLFGELPADRELFIDTSHFPGAGNAIVARELAKALDWAAP